LISIALSTQILNLFAFDSSNKKPIFYTESLSKNIRSVQIENYATNPYYPVFELGSDDFVTLKFDDISPDANTYGYRIVHCNATWQEDELTESQYINGFTGAFLSNYEISRNTFVVYHHYELNFPNEDASPLISGNYVIIVYNSETPDKPVLTARFMVVESDVILTCKALATTDIDSEKTHQQLYVQVDYPQYNIGQPSTDLKVVVQQNNRIDNQAILDAPTYYEKNSVNYKLNRNLIFDAGNEYRTFDMTSKYVLDNSIKSFEYFNPFFHATLFNSIDRSKLQYESWSTVSGRYVVNLQNSDYPEIEADYAFVHFTLPVERPFLDGKVHIIGELTGNRITPESQMSYNYETGAYEGVLFLKQGGYNYMYAYVPDGEKKGDLSAFEGNFWQTTNEYSVFVYFHPFGSLYDRLIGYWVGYFK